MQLSFMVIVNIQIYLKKINSIMISKTKFKGLIIIKNKSFKDKRGYFKELFREKEINKKFPFIVMSLSKKNVIKRIAYSKKIYTRENIFR